MTGLIMEAERKRQGRRRLQRQKSFTDALKEKYCAPEVNSVNSGGFVVDIVYHGKPKTNGSDAELAYLRNVVLCDRHISMAGLPSGGLKSLCPNVNELDLSGNQLNDWSEVLTIMSHLPFLKFVNFSRNQLINKEDFLQKWSTPLNTVESLVLNETGASWDEVLTVARYLPKLKELHTCKNGYTELSSSSSSLSVLDKVTYLKMNYNEINSWEEVWKLRHLPELDTLILSGNPLKDVVYKLMDDPDHVSMETDNTNTETSDRVEQKCENGHDNSEQSANDIVEEVLLEAVSDVEQLQMDQSENIQGGEKDENANKSADEFAKDIVEEVLLDALSEVEHSKVGEANVYEHNYMEVIENDRSAENNSDVKNTEDNCQMCNTDNSSPVKFYLDSETKLGECSSNPGNDSKGRQPFPKLKSLCLSDTCLDSWEHLDALSVFPALESLRIQDINLLAEHGEDDRRKLKIASLPNIKILNGSEVTVTEREKAERYYIRYFMEQETQPERYRQLEAKHGKLKPIVDIDISRGLKEEATLTFIYHGAVLEKETFKVKDLVKELWKFAVKLIGKWRPFKMFHYGCGPNHPKDEEVVFQELQSNLLQISRFDIMDGDEIHMDG